MSGYNIEQFNRFEGVVEEGDYFLPNSNITVSVKEKSIKVGYEYLYFARKIKTEDLFSLDNIMMMGRESLAKEIRQTLNVPSKCL